MVRKMKSESGIFVKAISAFFAVFIMLSAFPLQVSAENEIILSTALEDDPILIILHNLVEGNSGTSLQPMVKEIRKISLSVDGLGTDSNGTIQLEKLIAFTGFMGLVSAQQWYHTGGKT